MLCHNILFIHAEQNYFFIYKTSYNMRLIIRRESHIGYEIIYKKVRVNPIPIVLSKKLIINPNLTHSILINTGHRLFGIIENLYGD